MINTWMRTWALLLFTFVSFSGYTQPAAAEGNSRLTSTGSEGHRAVEDLRRYFSGSAVSRRKKRYGRYIMEFNSDGTWKSPSSGEEGKWWGISTGKLCLYYGAYWGGRGRTDGGITSCYLVKKLINKRFRLIWPNGRGWTHRFDKEGPDTASLRVVSLGTVSTFTVEGRDAGYAIRRDQCRWADTSVWVVIEGKGDCIRYFSAGVGPSNALAHVWFHGDRMRQKKSRYNRMTPEWLQRRASRIYERDGIPYIRISRPGTHGSSGHHGERRRPRESKLMNAALDQIKARYQIKLFALSGQSGGGHIVGSLLNKRSDIVCAVITSGLVSVRERLVARNRTVDYTGFTDYYDPIVHVQKISADPNRRIFVIGDPEDKNVPFQTQQSYFNALKKHGHNAWLVRGNGRGKRNHGLGWLGFRVTKWCVDGLSSDVIVSRAQEAK